ncbi:MAG: PQQ-binding-like beta-propeller repeat protein [Verrucomicrobiaceae bacterium]|nr:PQQ-binding-like beta-propeller repeat protein [Verrucomicrobiaceae bacterium]
MKMPTRHIPQIIICTLAFLIGNTGNCCAEPSNWPGFRGKGNSRSSLDNLPVNWSVNQGILWKTAITGFGQSSPTIWGHHVYVTSTGGKNKESLFLECLDLASGKVIWKRTIEATEKVKEVTSMISQGAPTPVTGPKGIYVFFESGDLLAFDHDGKRRWDRSLTREFGKFKGGHGIGSSLVGVPGELILLIDHEGPSYLICVDRLTGKTRWKTPRKPRVSWTTPLYLKHKGEEQIIISSNGTIEGYRLTDGKKIWWFNDIQKNTVASPSSANGLIFAASSYPKQSLAIRLGGKGDISDTHLEWRAKSVTSSFASPLIDQNLVFFINRAGTLQTQRIEDGTQCWEHKLPDGCWASPLAAAGKIYLFCKNGTSLVMEASALEPKVIAENAIPVNEGDKVYGYAVSENKFILRTGTAITCIGK